MTIVTRKQLIIFRLLYMVPFGNQVVHVYQMQSIISVKIYPDFPIPNILFSRLTCHHTTTNTFSLPKILPNSFTLSRPRDEETTGSGYEKCYSSNRQSQQDQRLNLNSSHLRGDLFGEELWNKIGTMKVDANIKDQAKVMVVTKSHYGSCSSNRFENVIAKWSFCVQQSFFG